jgi:hypothetical protein
LRGVDVHCWRLDNGGFADEVVNPMGLFGLLKRPAHAKKSPPVVVMRELPSPKPAEKIPPPPSADELRQHLFDAIATGDEAKVTDLCRMHRQFIAEYAPTWMIVPDSLKENPAAADWYARGFSLLAQLCRDEAGR